jgi:hypothetical protein
MHTNTIFNRYTSDSRFEYVVELTVDGNNQWEVARVVEFKIGRTSGTVVGLLRVPWAIRQVLWDQYQIGL